MPYHLTEYRYDPNDLYGSREVRTSYTRPSTPACVTVQRWVPREDEKLRDEDRGRQHERHIRHEKRSRYRHRSRSRRASTSPYRMYRSTVTDTVTYTRPRDHGHERTHSDPGRSFYRSRPDRSESDQDFCLRTDPEIYADLHRRLEYERKDMWDTHAQMQYAIDYQLATLKRRIQPSRRSDGEIKELRERFDAQKESVKGLERAAERRKESLLHFRRSSRDY